MCVCVCVCVCVFVFVLKQAHGNNAAAGCTSTRGRKVDGQFVVHLDVASDCCANDPSY